LKRIGGGFQPGKRGARHTGKVSQKKEGIEMGKKKELVKSVVKKKKKADAAGGSFSRGYGIPKREKPTPKNKNV